MPRYLRVILLVIAALFVLWFGGFIFNKLTKGLPNLNEKPTSTYPNTTVGPPPTRVVINLSPVEMGTPCANQGVVMTFFGATLLNTSGGFTPGTDNVYMVADVQIENTSLDQYEYVFINFGLTDKNGQTYFPVHSSPVIAPAPALNTGTLTKGASVRGNVLFEIPSGVTSGTFKYLNETDTTETWCQFNWK